MLQSIDMDALFSDCFLMSEGHMNCHLLFYAIFLFFFCCNYNDVATVWLTDLNWIHS